MNLQTVTASKSFGVGLSLSRLPKTFAENFNAMQALSGLTGRAISVATGIGESEISEYRTGKGGVPEVWRLLRLARALNCTVEDLVAGLDADYDAARDLVRHGGVQESGLPQPGGSLDVSASARILELERIVAAQKIALSKVQDVASELVRIAAIGEQDATAPRDGSGNRSGDRKTG